MNDSCKLPSAFFLSSLEEREHLKVERVFVVILRGSVPQLKTLSSVPPDDSMESNTPHEMCLAAPKKGLHRIHA